MARAALARDHLNAERFRLAAGFEAVHVPFRGAPDAVREVLGGRIDFYFSPLPAVTALVESKQLDGLAVSSLQRDTNVPNIRQRWKPVIRIPTISSGWRFCAVGDAEGYRATPA